MRKEIKEVGFETSKGRIPIKVIEIIDNKIEFNKKYFNKVDITKVFKNKSVVSLLLSCDKTEHRGYINLGDFLRVAYATNDSEFYAYVQDNFIKDTDDSRIYKNLLTLKELCDIAYDNKTYNDIRDEVGFYDLLSQDLMHEQELSNMNNREILEWNKKFNILRLQRRAAKNEVAFRDAVRSSIKPTKKNKEELARLLAPAIYYAGRKQYKNRINQQRRAEWEESIADLCCNDMEEFEKEIEEARQCI